MLIVCNVQFSNLIKKTIEILLDGSERAILKIKPTGCEFQAVDSLAVSVYVFRFLAARFFRYDVLEPHTVKLNLRPLHMYLKAQPPGSLVFSSKNKSVYVTVLSKYLKHDQAHAAGNCFNLHHNATDRTKYFDINPDLFRSWACFSIDTEEFSNIILDLSVGGGYLDICLDKNTLELTTIFETGRITITATAQQNHGKEFRMNRAPPSPIKNRYLTKFFKQSCGIVPTCVDMKVFIKPNGPIVLEMTLENNISKLYVCMMPVGNEFL